VFAIAATLAVATLLYLGRDLLFHFDEWIWVHKRRDPSVDTLLEPYNGHLSIVPVAIYQLFLWIFGITEYTPFRVLVAGFHVITIALVFVYVRRRLPVIPALVTVAVLLFFGAAWQDLLWPFQIGFLLSVAGGVGAFVLLDAQRPGTDRWAAVCLGLALASSSIGIPITIGLVIDLVARRDWNRWWVAGIPVALYTVWYAAFGGVVAETRTQWATAKDPGPIDVVRFAFESAGSTVGALVGAGSTVGQVLLLPVLAVLVGRWIRADARRRARLLALVAIPTSFWILIGISRFGLAQPTTSRYLYPAAVFVVLLLAECLSGLRVPMIAVAVLIGVATWSLVWNSDRFDYGRQFLLSDARHTRIELGAIDLGTRGVDAEYAAHRPPLHRVIREWVSAFEDLGFPGASPRQIETAREPERRRADAFLTHAAGVELTEAGEPGGRAPAVRRGGPGIADGASCVVLRSRGTALSADVEVLTPAVRIESVGGPVDVRVRRFAGETYFTGEAAWGLLHTGETRGIWLPTVADGNWTVGVATRAGARVCGVTDPPT
jgi:hypothetical protein